MGVKAMLKKHERSKVAKVKAQSDEQPQEFEMDLVNVVKTCIVHERGELVNVSRDWTDFESGKLCVLGDGRWAEAICGLSMYKGFGRILVQEEREGGIACVLPA